MPYRRLPNTDSARIKAMKLAHEKGNELPPFKLAFSQTMFQRIKSTLPSFENAISEHKNSLNLHADKNKEYQKRLKKAKLYISHFIQVVDMAIIRGDLKAEIRAYYSLNEEERKLPGLTTEEEILSWGKRIIEGEKNRRQKGLAPITNPTIAVVQVHYDKFIDAFNHQKSLKKRSSHAHDVLDSLRSSIDDIIQQTWNEIEETYKDLPEEVRREKCMKYGVVYVFRKNELSGINLFQGEQTGASVSSSRVSS
jgi:hypothetical protein